MSEERLFLIDAHGLCYRSFYGIRGLITKDGQHTNAIYGFINTLKKILRENNPEHIAFCFDSPEKTNRQEKFAEYKITRPSMPMELRSQIPIIKDVIKSFNLNIFECPGLEADDLIATLSKKACQIGLEVVIVSEDKDLYQLVDEKISILSVKKGIILDEEKVKDILGFKPCRIPDYIGLAGDKSDNIPGVDGIGAVTAKKLILQYGTLEEILSSSLQITSAKVREKLLKQKDIAVLSKDLATLEFEAPIDINMDQLRMKLPDTDMLIDLYEKLEFDRWRHELLLEKQEQIDLNIKTVDSSPDLQSLKQAIIEKGKVAFLLDDISEESKKDMRSVPEGGLLLSLGDDQIYRISMNKKDFLKEVLENKKIIKIVYDIKEFLRTLFFRGEGKDIINIFSQRTDSSDIFDLMLAGYVLSSTESLLKISDMAWNYLKIAIPPENKRPNEILVLFKLYSFLHDELKKKSCYKLFEEIEMPLSFVLFKMERHGVNINTDFLHELSQQCDEKINDLTRKLHEIAGQEVNLKSPKQLSFILFEKLKLPVVKKIKTGYSTNEAVLAKLAPLHEFPSLILEYRQLTKLKSTYIDSFPALVDANTKRIHAHFIQTGTETGRLSSRNPNLQNIPIRTKLGSQIRKAIIPHAKNTVLIKADYSQIELRILAHLSGDDILVNAFLNQQDVHRFTASLIFDVNEEQVTKEMRDVAKRVNFGIVYGMSAFGLAKDLSISNEDAREFIDRYFLRYPGVRKFLDETIKNCQQQGFVSTLLGRRREILQINNNNLALRQFAERQATNAPVQGSAADLIKIAMINVQREIERRHLSAKMIISVHDELVFDVKRDEVDELVDLLRDKMEHSIELSVPLSVSIKIGPNWGDMEDLTSFNARRNIGE